MALKPPVSCSVCSATVEHTPRNQKAWGSNPARCRAFFFFYLFLLPVECPKSGSSRRCLYNNVLRKKKWKPCYGAWGKTSSISSDWDLKKLYRCKLGGKTEVSKATNGVDGDDDGLGVKADPRDVDVKLVDVSGHEREGKPELSFENLQPEVEVAEHGVAAP